jgi:hypothetical protein
MAYVDETAQFGSDVLVYTRKKIAEVVIGTSTEVGLEVNAEKTKCVLLSRHQNTGHLVINRPVENVTQFRYLGTTVTHLNLIQEEKMSLNDHDK